MRKTSFKYFLVSKGYGEGELDETLIYLSERGLKLLDQLLIEQDKKNLNDKTSKESGSQ